MADRPRKYQHHPLAFKRQIVEASLVAGTSVAGLAQRHGLNANQVWAWRKLYNEGRLQVDTPELLAVDVVSVGPVPHPPQRCVSAGRLEITIGSARLTVTGTIEADLLKAAIAALRT